MNRIRIAVVAAQVIALCIGAAGCAGSNPKVQIEMEDGGKITVALDRENAPLTVENFLSLVNSSFYDGLTFHRIVPGFVIQGGDPNGDGTGGSDKQIKGEFRENGVNNNISHVRGVISMARSLDNNSASSQFFITLSDDAVFLDGKYAAFGKVTSGMDVVDKIAAVPTSDERPLQPVIIKSIKVIN